MLPLSDSSSSGWEGAVAHESGTDTASWCASCCFICALSTDLSPGDDWQNFMGLRNFKQLINGCKICLLDMFNLFSCTIYYLSNLFIPYNLCTYLIRHSCINKYKGNGTLYFLLDILLTKIIVQFDVKNFACFSWISSDIRYLSCTLTFSLTTYLLCGCSVLFTWNCGPCT